LGYSFPFEGLKKQKKGGGVEKNPRGGNPKGVVYPPAFPLGKNWKRKPTFFPPKFPPTPPTGGGGVFLKKNPKGRGGVTSKKVYT